VSDDLLGFEPVDDELRRRLAAVGPPPGDPDGQLRELTPRYRRARRRHRAVTGGAAVAAVLGAVLVVALALPGGGARRVRVPAAATTAGPAPTAPAAPDPPATLAPTAATPTPDTDPSSAAGSPVATAAPVQHVYSSAGGSVTVRIDGGLSIVATVPAAGYRAELHDTGPARIEVRFTKDGVEWRVRVDLVDGAPVEEITRH
jgi:hypothetical protein